MAQVWVGIEPVKSWERYQAQQLHPPMTHKITMRYLSLFWLTVFAMALLALTGCSYLDIGYCPYRVFPNSSQF